LCKIHLKTDFDGLPIAFQLTRAQVSDSTQLKTSLYIGPGICRVGHSRPSEDSAICAQKPVFRPCVARWRATKASCVSKVP
jgi:hypothetical protein